MYACRARRAHVARHPPRAAPSLSTERRPKRRRETRTTTGDGTREEDEERTTAARYVPAEVQRLEPPTRARGAGARARARLLAQRGRRGAARRQRESRRRGLSPTKFRSWDAARASACTYARAISRDRRTFRGQSLGLQVGRANKSQTLSLVALTMELKNACLHHIDRFFAIDRAERRPKRWHGCI